MTIPRELLWRAWPEGRILSKGITTVGGWHIKESDLVQSEFTHLSGEPKSLDQAQVDGDLLPRVDPRWTASWAVVLKDFAQVCWTKSGLIPDDSWYAWRACMLPSLEDSAVMVSGWVLEVFQGPLGVNQKRFPFYIDVDFADPATALVYALIQVREGVHWTHMLRSFAGACFGEELVLPRGPWITWRPCMVPTASEGLVSGWRLEINSPTSHTGRAVKSRTFAISVREPEEALRLAQLQIPRR